MALVHFLLVYDLRNQRLLDTRPFDDGERAVVAYAEAERLYEDRSDLEIVLVAADSLDTIKQTHAHYFEGRSLADPFLAPV